MDRKLRKRNTNFEELVDKSDLIGFYTREETDSETDIEEHVDDSDADEDFQPDPELESEDDNPIHIQEISDSETPSNSPSLHVVDTCNDGPPKRKYKRSSEKSKQKNQPKSWISPSLLASIKDGSARVLAIPGKTAPEWRFMCEISYKGNIIDGYFCKLCFEDRFQIQVYKKGTGSKNFKKHISSCHQDVYRKEFLDKEIPNEDAAKIKDKTISSYLKVDSSSKSFQKYNDKEKKMSHGRKLALLACESYIPFNALTSNGFKRYLLSNGANLKDFSTDRTLVGAALEDLYVLCLRRVKASITKECPKFCSVSTDSWTDSHLGNTYINYNLIFFHKPQRELKTVLLEVAPYTNSKTGENLNSDLKRVLKEFQIIDRNIFTVNDSAKNNVRSHTISKEDPELHVVARIGCIAHHIHNLVYTDIFDSKHFKNQELGDLIRKLNKIHQALHYKKSEMSLAYKAEFSEEAWKQIQEHCEEYADVDWGEITHVPTAAPLLKKSNVTRWNSTLTMLKSFLPLSNIIKSILCQNNKFHLLISDGEKKIIRELVEILELFEAAVKLCQESCYSSLSIMICFLRKITLSMDSKLKQMNTSGSYSDVAQCVLKELRRKLFDPFDVSNENLVSAILDPALKNAAWIDDYLPKSENGIISKSRKQILKDCLEDFGIIVGGNNHQQSLDAENRNEKLNSVLKSRMELFKDLGVVDVSNQKRSSLDQEIHDYLEIEVLEIPDSPLTWWDSNQMKFPRLKQLFEAFLSAAPSSSSSERAFSKAGKFLNADRSNLNPSKLNMMCFINANVKYLEEYEDIFLTKKATDL